MEILENYGNNCKNVNNLEMEVRTQCLIPEYLLGIESIQPIGIKPN